MHRLASRINGIALISALLLLLGCQGKHGSDPIGSPGGSAAIVDVPPVIASDNGYVTGMLGAWSWVSDRTIPERGRLEPVRFVAQEQGDLYSLSIQAFLTTDSLKLISATPVAEGMEYTLRFKHPIPLPADLERPSTASKRLDLFLFDVELLIARNGSDSYFGGVVTTDIDLVQDPDGFRRPGPIVDLPSLGITSADTFPYRLLTLNDPADPRGNYDSVGWDGAEYLSARGFDVIPQGATVTTSLIGPAEVPFDTKIILLAKYMDPRSGATIDELRANRLPDPLDSTAFQYYLPEAAGDVEQIVITPSGSLLTDGIDEVATLDINILDWDHAAPIAVSFPNPAQPREIRQASAPISISASFPEFSPTPFTGAVDGLITGLAGEWISKTLEIRNVSQTITLPEGESLDVNGLVRVLDQQDDAPGITLLDESLVPLTAPASFRPSTRYQHATIRVSSGKLPPTVLGVEPTEGAPGAIITLAAATKGPMPTSWSWDFGGGATPNSSTDAQPLITLGAEGTYNATFTATNAYGTSVPYPFTLTVMLAPQITAVNPGGFVGWNGDLASFTVSASGGPLTGYDWNFGGGATPNTSTVAMPSVTLSGAGTFTGSLTVDNAFGTSAPFEFQYTVDPATSPVITGISPTGTVGFAGASVQFESYATNHPTGWAWDFGGGASPNTSSLEQPTVTLGAAGIYNGEVTVSNPFRPSTQGFQFEVLAVPQVPTILSVSPAGTIGLEGTNTTFSAVVTESPTSWSWSFGGGTTPNTSTAVNPTVVLNGPGNYSGVVTATNGNGSSLPFPFDFTVGAPPAPVIQSVTPVGVIDGEGGYHTFSAIATNAPTEWLWTFGGGATPNFSTLATPAIQLGIPGTYTGTVSASNSGGASPSFEFEYTIDNRVTNWALTVDTPDSNNISGEELLIGPDGVMYWMGWFLDEADFDPGAGEHFCYQGSPMENGFLLALTPKAKYSWVQIMGETDGSWSFVDLEFATPSRLETAGDFGDDLYFDSDTQPGPQDDRIVPDGANGVWLNAFGTDGVYLDVAKDYGSQSVPQAGNSITSMQTCSDGSTLITAYNSGTAHWNVPGESWQTSFYVLKTTLDRQFVWVKRFTEYSVKRSAEAPNGDLLLVGEFADANDFDPGTGIHELDPGANKDAAVTCLDSDGNFQWVSVASGSGTFAPQGFEVAADGTIHVVGNLTGIKDFDPGPGELLLGSMGSTDAVHWVLSPEGNLVLAQQLGAGAADTADSIIFDTLGNIYIGGNFTGQVDFDPGAGASLRLSSGLLDCYIVSLTSSGNFRWVSSWGGVLDDDLNDLATNGTRILATGVFKGSADFDPGPGVVQRVAKQTVYPVGYFLTLHMDGTY